VARFARALPAGSLTVACNGMIGRELYGSADAPSRFYMIGSMGLASSIGLGLALVRPDETVVVFDGDGNVLMNLGTLGSIAAARPSNLYHVVFDNAAHGSTGDQRTISDRVPIEEVARAAGYRTAARVRGETELDAALAPFFDGAGPAMLLVEVERGNVAGITRVELAPAAITARFRQEVCGAV
jgi:sulfopyruvate decarboxylase subunit beta